MEGEEVTEADREGDDDELREEAVEGDGDAERPAVGDTEGDRDEDGVKEGELRFIQGFHSGGRITTTTSPLAPGNAAPPPPLKGVRVMLPNALSATPTQRSGPMLDVPGLTWGELDMPPPE